MVPDLYMGKAQAEDDLEASETVFSSLETPRASEYLYDLFINVVLIQEEHTVRLRALPEFKESQWLLYPDDPFKQAWDAGILL